MEYLYHWSQSNPQLYFFITFVLSILGIILTIWFGLKSLSFKKIACYIEGENLIKDFSNQFKELNIIFDQKDINILSVSRITIWNSGKQPITNKDVSQVEPLLISLKKDVKILSIKLLHESKKSNMRVKNQIRFLRVFWIMIRLKLTLII